VEDVGAIEQRAQSSRPARVSISSSVRTPSSGPWRRSTVARMRRRPSSRTSWQPGPRWWTSIGSIWR